MVLSIRTYSSKIESTFGQIDRCTAEGVPLYSVTPRHADSWRPPTQILYVAVRTSRCTGLEAAMRQVMNHTEASHTAVSHKMINLCATSFITCYSTTWRLVVLKLTTSYVLLHTDRPCSAYWWFIYPSRPKIWKIDHSLPLLSTNVYLF